MVSCQLGTTAYVPGTNHLAVLTVSSSHCHSYILCGVVFLTYGHYIVFPLPGGQYNLKPSLNSRDGVSWNSWSLVACWVAWHHRIILNNFLAAPWTINIDISSILWACFPSLAGLTITAHMCFSFGSLTPLIVFSYTLTWLCFFCGLLCQLLLLPDMEVPRSSNMVRRNTIYSSENRNTPLCGSLSFSFTSSSLLSVMSHHS